MDNAQKFKNKHFVESQHEDTAGLLCDYRCNSGHPRPKADEERPKAEGRKGWKRLVGLGPAEGPGCFHHMKAQMLLLLLGVDCHHEVSQMYKQLTSIINKEFLVLDVSNLDCKIEVQFWVEYSPGLNFETERPADEKQLTPAPQPLGWVWRDFTLLICTSLRRCVEAYERFFFKRETGQPRHICFISARYCPADDHGQLVYGISKSSMISVSRENHASFLYSRLDGVSCIWRV